jgi:AcrR family transcriptional regulator
MRRPARGLGEKSGPRPERRTYDSPVRRKRAAETRARIVESGSALVRGFPSWDWRDLTFRAVAEQAGVSERTVYRYFANERELHRAVMRRLEEEAGVSCEDFQLENLAGVTARVFASRLSFSAPAAIAQPPFAEEDSRRRQALLAAVLPLTVEWSDAEREMAAGLLDIMWAIPSYERLITAWNLAPLEATRAVTWALGLVMEAIQNGHRPDSAGVAQSSEKKITL